MLNKIKNIFSKLTSGKIQIIKGLEGFQLNIKDLYLINNTNKRIFCDVYFIDSKQIRTYFFKNTTIPPKTRFDIPNKNNITLIYRESIYVELSDSDLVSDVDVFCNYILKETFTNKIGVEFQNQLNQIITDPSNVSWKIINSNDLKLIKITTTDKYSSVPDILYKIDGNILTIFKSDNLKPPKYTHTEYYDRYEINILNISKKNIYDSIKSFINVSFNIISSPNRDPKWKFSQEEIFADDCEWRNPYVVYDIFESIFYLTFSDVENYFKPNDISLNIFKNNRLDLEFKYKPSHGLLKIKTDYLVDNIRWNVIDIDGNISDDYYLPNMIKLAEGFYDVKINSIDDVFEEKIYHIYINSSQKHFLFHNIDEMNGQLQVNIDGTLTQEYWQVNNENNFTNVNTWYSSTDILNLNEDRYYINFKELENFTKPNIKSVYLSNNVRVVFNDEYTNNFGKVCISDSNLLEPSFFDSIEWRLKNETITTKWFNNKEQYITNFGEYDIEIKSSDDEILDLAAKINVYKEQKTTYLVNTLFGV